MLCAGPNSLYSASAVKVCGVVTVRRRVRSNTCMPCPVMKSATMNAWFLYTFMSRQELLPPLDGRLPRNFGDVGVLRSTNAVPLVRPTIAYSLPEDESVQPQTSLPLPPPIDDSGRTLSRSTFLQG